MWLFCLKTDGVEADYLPLKSNRCGCLSGGSVVQWIKQLTCDSKPQHISRAEDKACFSYESVLGQDTESQIAPDGQASALRGSPSVLVAQEDRPNSFYLYFKLVRTASRKKSNACTLSPTLTEAFTSSRSTAKHINVRLWAVHVVTDWHVFPSGLNVAVWPRCWHCSVLKTRRPHSTWLTPIPLLVHSLCPQRFPYMASRSPHAEETSWERRGSLALLISDEDR